MLSVFAELETNLRKERQLEGIQRAKDLGKYKGRKEQVDASVVQHWITTEDFFYCHWIARNEQDIYKTLEKWGVEGTKINSMASEAYEYVTAFRSSETVFKKF